MSSCFALATACIIIVINSKACYHEYVALYPSARLVNETVLVTVDPRRYHEPEFSSDVTIT